MRIDEFLLARVAEDEAVCERFSGELQLDMGDGTQWTWSVDRLRAECEAKRRIVSLHGITETKSWTNPWDGPAYEETEHTCELCGWCDAPACLTLVSLAAVYADHPDFDPAWRL